MNLGEQVPRNGGVAAFELQVVEPLQQRIGGSSRNVRNGATGEPNRACDRIESRAQAGIAGGVAVHDRVGWGFVVPELPHLRAGATSFGPFAFALGTRQCACVGAQTGTETGNAPTVARVEGEEPRIQISEAGGTDRASPPCREQHGGLALGEHADHPFAKLQRALDSFAQTGLLLGQNHQVSHGQFNRMFDIAIQTRPRLDGQRCAIHPEVTEALASRPLGQLAIEALAGGDQRSQEGDALTTIGPHQARDHGLEVLGRDRDLTGRTVLRPELDVEQTQEMMNLGQGRDGTLAATTTRALLDGNRWRNSKHMVDIGPG